MTRWLLAIMAVAVAAGTGAWVAGLIDEGDIAALEARLMGPKAEASQTKLRAPAVTVIQPQRRTFRETLQVSGSLVAREEILIAPQIEGQRVRELLADESDDVRQGQLLARLETENLDALMAQNDASLARAEAGIAQAESQIVQAKARLDEAAAALERAGPLSRAGHLSQSLLDQRQASATSAEAAVAIARNALKLAEAEKALAAAQRRELTWRHERTEIRAPADGLVLERAAKVGAIASASAAPMFRIAAGGEIEFDGEVTGEQLPRVRPDQPVRITVGGVGDVEGRVRLVAARVDPASRLARVRVFIGADRQLKVGSFATGQIETAKSDGIAVPASAVMHDRDGAYVLVVADGRVATRRLSIGIGANGLVEVRDGLKADDWVIAKAGTFLRPGDQVTPVKGRAGANSPEAG